MVGCIAHARDGRISTSVSICVNPSSIWMHTSSVIIVSVNNYIQIVQVQWRWVHLADRSKRVICWRVSLTVTLSRVTRGLTVMERSCLLVVPQSYLLASSVWLVQPPATSLLHVALRTSSVEMPSVRIWLDLRVVNFPVLLCTTIRRFRLYRDRRGLII